MFKLTKLITAADGADRSKLEAALNGTAKANGVVRSMLNPTLPNVYNGGDYIWHLQFNDEAAYNAWKADPAGGKAADAVIADKAQVKLAESAAYQGGRSGSKPGAPAKGCYRTLFLSANQAPSEAAVKKFDDETYMMGVYIHTIKNWQVSRVKEASGSRPWTHIWEQEYEDLSGLQGAYMLHPHHWGHIDRWYDPECTDYMIDTYLCHTFCNFDGSVIAPKS
ncbi:MAG TPA: Dabb family protein [Alphaproteobacteria bacterium]|jgi:hypothetical protein|nr:Dabb family protein [Alphaproteobacteria bacterium]